LEWATSSPPPEHNFTWLPPIRSERPVFDLRWINHERIGASGAADAWVARQHHDDHWLPLHQWSRSPDEEPTADDRPQIPGHGERPTHRRRGDE
jgi:cytochrome c oxidase subunit 1